MTFDALWEQLTSKNALLKTGTAKVTITADQFKKALEQSYEQGREQEKTLNVRPRDISKEFVWRGFWMNAMKEAVLRSPCTAPPDELKDIILKMPRPVSQEAYDKVIQYMTFLRDCSNQQWENMFKLLEMSRECIVSDEKP